jgi:hypothetical protein
MFTTKKKTLGTKTYAPLEGNSFISAASKKSAETVSGNNAKKFKTTGNEFVDQFGKLGEYKAPRSYSDIAKDCSILYAEDPESFVKFTIYMRMISRKTDIVGMGIKTEAVQSGAELKHESTMRMIWLHNTAPNLFWKNIGLFISAGSCKDLIVMLRYDLVYHGWDGKVLNWGRFSNLLLSLLSDDKTSNLMKKYLPQIRSKTQLKTVEAEANCIIAKWICSNLFGKKNDAGSYRKYRKLKASGTAHEWQKLISQSSFDRIDFGKIHGRALNLLVKSKFLKNQGLSERYSEWVDKQETVKYTGFAHECLCELRNNRESNFVKTVDKQFYELIAKAKEGVVSKFIVVRDTSGSMESTATGTKFSSDDIAKSIALYFNEFLDGDFKDYYIEFNDNAKMVKWKGSTPSQKWTNDLGNAYGGTNFQSVIDLFCNLKKTVSESDFPEGILCISDGEFDASELGKTNVESARSKLRSAGFSEDYINNFKIVLWNIPNSFYGSRSETKFETYGDVKNVFYLSGYSASNVKFIMSGKVETAADLFNAAMDQELLRLVEV